MRADDEQRSGTSVPPVKVVDFHQAPTYLRRPYILHGYRVGGTRRMALAALFYELNNETLNAWTMILGIIYSTWRFWTVLIDTARAEVHISFLILWFAAASHVGFSIALHAFIGISEAERVVFRTLDVVMLQQSIFLKGVAFCLALPVPGWFLTFYVFGVVVVLMYSFYTCTIRNRIWTIPKPELARHMQYITFGYLLPLWTYAALNIGGLTLVASITFLIWFGGAVLYAKHYPERLWPGVFDCVASSHILMHLVAQSVHVLEYRFLDRALADVPK
ncbi:Membrane progestin receptor gamma [Porphyridium purpureum]|uniref:Membrane progestin receptor gamma n=1 Tax=Porphyridium purpureum TaxID=35688 RepID=A0A5J4YX60_PORPP|nr:Membrane progestin receptor gamma [Porphyridium purpureum]|eukprot:POR8921..scf209_3